MFVPAGPMTLAARRALMVRLAPKCEAVLDLLQQNGFQIAAEGGSLTGPDNTAFRSPLQDWLGMTKILQLYEKCKRLSKHTDRVPLGYISGDIQEAVRASIQALFDRTFAEILPLGFLRAENFEYSYTIGHEGQLDDDGDVVIVPEKVIHKLACGNLTVSIRFDVVSYVGEVRQLWWEDRRLSFSQPVPTLLSKLNQAHSTPESSSNHRHGREIDGLCFSQNPTSPSASVTSDGVTLTREIDRTGTLIQFTLYGEIFRPGEARCIVWTLGTEEGSFVNPGTDVLSQVMDAKQTIC